MEKKATIVQYEIRPEEFLQKLEIKGRLKCISTPNIMGDIYFIRVSAYES